MKRRDFLKAMLGVAAIALAPIPVLDKYPHFDPQKSCGDFVTTTDPMAEIAFKHLDEQIGHCVPPEYHKQIEYRSYAPGRNTDPLDQVHTYGWKYIPAGRAA